MMFVRPSRSGGSLTTRARRRLLIASMIVSTAAWMGPIFAVAVNPPVSTEQWVGISILLGLLMVNLGAIFAGVFGRTRWLRHFVRAQK